MVERPPGPHAAGTDRQWRQSGQDTLGQKVIGAAVWSELTIVVVRTYEEIITALLGGIKGNKTNNILTGMEVSILSILYNTYT